MAGKAETVEAPSAELTTNGSNLAELTNPGSNIEERGQGNPTPGIDLEKGFAETSFTFGGLRSGQELLANAHDAFMNGAEFSSGSATPLPKFDVDQTTFTQVSDFSPPLIADVLIALVRAEARGQAARLAERAGVDVERMLSLVPKGGMD